MSPEARERSFDELASGLASGSLSRRRALRLMGAALVGGTLASLGFGGVAAADPPGCKRNGKHCKKDKQCCSGNCSDGTCGGCSSGADGTCAGCPLGTVELSNGTCAKPCDTSADCAGCDGCAFASRTGGVRTSYCVSGPGRPGCTTDDNCPRGQFCSGGVVCLAAC
jgi:hypothetical protein